MQNIEFRKFKFFDFQFEFCNSREGFTLLELIIVIFLVSLITGLSSLFFMNALPSRSFDNTVRDITAGIRHAKALAGLNGEDQKLLIDMDNREFGISGRTMKKIPDGISVMVIDFLDRQSVSGEYHIVFRAGGGVEGGTIVLIKNNKKASIYIDPVVGAVAVK